MAQLITSKQIKENQQFISRDFQLFDCQKQYQQHKRYQQQKQVRIKLQTHLPQFSHPSNLQQTHFNSSFTLFRQTKHIEKLEPLKFNMNDQLVQSYEEQSFPSFPVIFQPQISQIQQKQSKITSSSDSGLFKKLPQYELNQLKQNLKNMPKYDTKYSFLWTDQLSKLKVQQFLLKMYQPFDHQFINDFIKELHGVKISRIGDHKVCVGKIKDNLCSGDCVIIFKNGTVYEGEMLENKRHGKGVYYDPNLGIYRGFFKKDMKEGQGVEVLQNKIIFKGTFMNGLRHCTNGLYVDFNENEYFGQWKLGIMHGKGFLKTKNSIYHGIFVNWLKHGQGQEKFIEGDSYQGQYQNGRFDGFGTYKWANGAVYEGLFKNGFRHGKGKWSENEAKYLGNYSEGLKEGYGELYLPSGNFYKGNFANDHRQGYGEMFWTDGSFYKGEWRNGSQNGKGQIYLSGNQIMSGLFQNSILVQVTPAPFAKQGFDGEPDTDYTNSEPKGLMGQKNRTFSQHKGFNYNKKLYKIDQNVRKPQNSMIKGNMYFRSPEKSDRSLSKRKLHSTHHMGHSHGGKQCKCVKRLQNFRLKQQIKSRVNDSRFNMNT